MSLNNSYKVVIISLIIKVAISVSAEHHNQRPNIIVIIADDVGWNDLSHHGSTQILTPNIDSLGYNGIIFNRHYSMQVCTPSRAAFLTGKYPIKTGYQGYPLPVGQHREIPHDIKTLPQSLKDLSYRTHLIGKWHLGHAKRSCTPLHYGYDSHFGYWNGYIGYFDHCVSIYDKYNGTDLHEDFQPITDKKGIYATDLFTERALEIIKKHPKDQPLHLVISHLAGHTGRTIRGIETTLEVHNLTENAVKYGFIADSNRRMYAEIIEKMDDSVGKVLEALDKYQMLSNSIIVVFSDNGAPTYGMHANVGSNWPLRGIKMSLFDGAIRVPAVLYSPKLQKKGRIYKNLFHITDWVPTLLSAAGGNIETFGEDLDGIDHWDNLFHDKNDNMRKEMLVDIDYKFNYSAFIGFNGRYKLINNSYFNSNFTGDSGKNYNRQDEYHRKLQQCPAHKILQKFSITNEENNFLKKVAQLINATQINCINKKPEQLCNNKCLYDLWSDPCETTNLADQYTDIFEKLWSKIQQEEKKMKKKIQQEFDEKADPKNCNGTWFNWLDGNDGCWYNLI